jgi:hypothetical protein
MDGKKPEIGLRGQSIQARHYRGFIQYAERQQAVEIASQVSSQFVSDTANNGVLSLACNSPLNMQKP